MPTLSHLFSFRFRLAVELFASAFLCATLFLSRAAEAQITNVGDTTSTPIQGAGHDYVKMLSETVNPSNGSVSIHIQVPAPPGRGVSLPFSFAYDSNGTAHVFSDGFGTAYWADNTAYLSKAGWSYSAPMLTNLLVSVPALPHGYCAYYDDYVFQDATGGRHSLGISDINTPTQCQSVANGPDPIQVLSGGDDYFRTSIASGGPGGGPLLIADSAGTVYTFLALAQAHKDPSNNNSASSLPSSIEDRNGNLISFTDGGSGAFTATDTLGRTLLSSSGFGTSGNTVTVSGLPSAYSVTWGTTNVNFSLSASLVYNE